MNIFITGSTGFIGKELLKRLAQTDHTCTCLVRESSDTQLHEQLGVKLVYGDILDKHSIVVGMTGCDAIIHNAALYSYWEPDKRVYECINVDGTRNVMEAALQVGVNKVVDISTATIYGRPATVPFTEETVPAARLPSAYARSKYRAHQVAWNLYATRSLPLVTILPTGVLGPGDPKRTGEDIARYVNGEMPGAIFVDSMMAFVHVRDVAEAIVRALELAGNIGEKYIVANQAIRWGEYAEMICDVAGVKAPQLPIPDVVVLGMARFFTALANIVKKPPFQGLNYEVMAMAHQGIHADGSKAERELGITYTPIRVAVEEEVAMLRQETATTATVDSRSGRESAIV